MDLITFLHVTLESGFALFCILAAIYIRLYETIARGLTRVITAMLLCSAVINIADALAYLYRGNTTQTGFVMVRVCNFIVFAGAFALLAGCSLMLDCVIKLNGGESEKRMGRALLAVCAAGLLTLVASIPFGFLYYFDEQNIYHRGPAYIVLTVLALAAMVLIAVRLMKERSRLSREQFAVFVCFLALPSLGAILQTAYYGISISNIANSLSILLMLTVFMRRAVRELSIRKSFILNGGSIDSISEELDKFLAGTGTERQNRIRVRFTIEDALMRIWDYFGDATMVRVTAGIAFGKPSIRIDHEGEAFNPFSKSSNTYDDWSNGLLSSAGISPIYSYSRGFNTVKINLSRIQINPVVTIAAVLVLGLVTGSVALVVLSPADNAFVTNEILVPVYDLWNRILYSVSAPAVLIIVMSTLLDTREVSEQGGSASRIVGRYLSVTLLAGAAAFVAAAILNSEAFLSETFTRSTGAELLSKLFHIVPENFIDPFVAFDTAQLILMGIVFAYAIMALGQQADGVISIIQQINLIVMQIARWIAGLMPVFTVFLTAQLVLEDNAELLLGLLVILPAAVVLSIIIMALTLLYVSTRMKVNPGLLLRKLWPSFIQTLKTGQLESSYALAEKCCRNDLGIQKIFTQRLMPLGLVLYMPVGAVGMISFVIYAAFASGMPITPVWMLSAVVFALILLVAAPPIPGVDLLSYVVIIGQLGISRKFIIAAMIFDIVFNIFASAANQMMLQMDLVLQADKVGLINHATLRKDNKNAAA